MSNGLRVKSTFELERDAAASGRKISDVQLPETCKVDGRPVRMMAFSGTGVCCQRCLEAL